MPGLRTSAVAASLAVASLLALLRTLDDRDDWEEMAAGERESRQALEEKIRVLQAAERVARAEARTRESGLQREVEHAVEEARGGEDAARSLAEVKARLAAAETALAAGTGGDREWPVASVRPFAGIELVERENPWIVPAVLVESEDAASGALGTRSHRGAQQVRELLEPGGQFETTDQDYGAARLKQPSRWVALMIVPDAGPLMNQGVNYVDPIPEEPIGTPPAR